MNSHGRSQDRHIGLQDGWLVFSCWPIAPSTFIPAGSGDSLFKDDMDEKRYLRSLLARPHACRYSSP
jgi:hypothetical protein